MIRVINGTAIVTAWLRVQVLCSIFFFPLTFASAEVLVKTKEGEQGREGEKERAHCYEIFAKKYP